MSHSTTMEPGEAIGAGDSWLGLNLLDAELAEVAFDRLRSEVAFQRMNHHGGEVPRLVAVEGAVASDGSFPIYRHPADESPPLHPFSPTVQLIRQYVEQAVKHPVNHVLIQLYRTGADYISEHSDKTIDVVKGSKIVNVSLGAQRTMTLRLKKDRESSHPTNERDGEEAGSVRKEPGPARETQRVPLPNNSIFVLGPETNAKWVHAVNQDRRLLSVKSEPEIAYEGARISLTFRRIGTFLTGDQRHIWGQGATSKSRELAARVVHGEEASTALIRAFGQENQMLEFDWNLWYGQGFDVVNFAPK
ncbi:unnamed protein product [Mycena citricolor]|uniref:Fe2OG dioxygenase domain-containing protein n=1 Tax=Mycena citricolor TaxID=2018698 RepID=A0AAD2K468_9AGAR|nr:unnamed protein product [Mycena citricolor]